MILELLLGLALLAAPARAEEGEEDPLSPYRTPFGVLVERSIGSTSKSVEYDWRRSRAQLAASGDHLFELNNFNSLRAGAMVRLPAGGLLYELGLHHVWVWDTPSSALLALTPYRQPGRPERLELDFNLGVPLAEGVVTTRVRFFPSVQMVFMAYAGLRYALYPQGFAHLKVGEVASALVSPTLLQEEIDNLEELRLDAMQVDPGRYGVLIGVGDDLYFKQGIFVSPRAMFGLPILAPVSQTELLFWADLSLMVGVAL